MDFDTFAARARAIAAAIPAEFMAGIDTVDVHRDAVPHPHVPDVFTLGMCETSHLSDPTGQEPFRSVVHVYYGSFVALAAHDTAFDVDAELEETIQHEVQHHLEDRAGLKTLLHEDDLFEAHARFRAGLDVPPGWYRFGEQLEPGLWAVDLDLFLELQLRAHDWARLRGTRLTFAILGEALEVDVPEDADPTEVWTFEGDGLLEGEEDEEEVAIEEDAEDLGLVGDLHVVPVVR